MNRAGAMAVLAVVVLAGCASTVQPTPSASLSAPEAPESAGASAAAGPLEIRGGDLAPGTYTHSGFEPRITFEVGEGWQGVQNASGFFDVQQDPDTPDVIAVQFGNVDGVVGEDGSTVEIGSAAEDTPDGVLAVLVGGSVDRWDETLAIAEPVLESVRIGDEAS